MGPSTGGNRYNVIEFIVSQILNRDVRVATPVVVLSVSGGGPAGPAVVSVQPLISQVDGVGNTTPHGEIYNVPAFRYSCGLGSVIADPQEDDVGLLVVSDRDTSSVQSTNGEPSAPGSSRTYDLADGIYLGRLFQGPDDQYVEFTSSGVTLADKNGNVIKMQAGSIAITTTSLTVNGSVIAGFGGADQVGLQTHEHTGNNTPPTPGT